MAHCPYENLSDLEPVFEKLRTWPGIREPKPGVFYFKSKPLLHFHIKAADRWAHIRSQGLWEKIDTPIPIKEKNTRTFLSQVSKHYSIVSQSKTYPKK